MSLHRWSLPTRTFARDKSENAESSGQVKFPTVHIGQPGPRRKVNLSAAFATVFEKPENYQSTPNPEGRGLGTSDLQQPLAPRPENVPPVLNLKSSHAHEFQNTAPIDIDTTSLDTLNKSESVFRNTGTNEIKSNQYLLSGIFDQITHPLNEALKVRSFSLTSTEDNEKRQQDELSSSLPTKSTDTLEKIRSTSSSYPSEGIRSPLSQCRSPEPTTYTKSFISEYRQYGTYPSHTSWYPSEASMNDISAGDATRNESPKVTVSSITDSSCNTTNQIYKPLRSFIRYAPEDYTEPTPTVVAQSRCNSSTFHGTGQDPQRSSNSEIMVPILENENAMTSQLEVSFMSYKRSNALSTSDVNDQRNISNDGSTGRLRPHEDTDETTQTTLRQPGKPDRGGIFSAIRDAREKRQSLAESWAQIFTLATANGSSTTLSQRFQKFKLRKWVKKVCFKTKTRFGLIVRAVPASKSAKSKASSRKWRHKKKVIKGRKNPKRKYLGISTTLTPTKERAKKHKKTADRFFDTLTAKKSLQLQPGRSEKENNDAIHRRVQSCPADISL
ncbi:hypothetical protein F5Y19DRAFT_484919 [Xylariaceae sp. FL1651]|nr:hypothetical protein F5Y19DRAFT_484919 [Xylariaceae sp. FL1651]